MWKNENVYFDAPLNKEAGIDAYTFPSAQKNENTQHIDKEKARAAMERCFTQSHPTMNIEVTVIRPGEIRPGGHTDEGAIFGEALLFMQAQRKDGKEITDDNIISLATTLGEIATAAKNIHAKKGKSIAE